MNDKENKADILTQQWNRLNTIMKQIEMIETKYPWLKNEPQPDPYTGDIVDVPWQNYREEILFFHYLSLKHDRDESHNDLTKDDIPF